MKTVAFVFCLIPLLASAQPNGPTYRQRMEALKQNINRHFTDPKTGRYKEFNYRDSGDKNLYSYLWPLCGLIQAANEWETVTSSEGYFASVLKSIQPYYDDAPPAPAYNSYIPSEKKEDRFYDDNQWIAIACLDAFQRTKRKNYLDEAKAIHRFMMTGFDTVSGGGLYWKEGDPSTKNTCSNGPGVLVALQLYKATGEKRYLDTALLLYDWTVRWLRAPQGVYYDNLKLPSRQIDKRLYTYNAGTMLQSNVLLYELTRDQRYLREANAVAEGAYNQFFRNGRWPRHYWFNAVLLRGYEALRQHNGDEKYLNAFAQDAEAIWNTERDKDGLIGRKQKKELIDQAAVLEIYARLARIVQ